MPSESDADVVMPEYTYFIGPGPGAEIVFEEGANLDCSFDVRERTPCDPLYRLISVEEGEDGTVTMVLGLVEEDDA